MACVWCAETYPLENFCHSVERKGMYLFDLKTVWETARKTAVPSHQMNNHVAFCRYNMLNAWWKSNTAWRCWIKWQQRWKRRNLKHYKGADQSCWHHLLSPPGYQKASLGFRWEPKSDAERAVQCRQCSSLTGADVMEHALKCLLRLLFFVWRTEMRRAFAEDVLKANQPLLCHLSPP